MHFSFRSAFFLRNPSATSARKVASKETTSTSASAKETRLAAFDDAEEELRALEKKKLVAIERSPTLQLRVPGEERDEEFPERDDERIVELEERRKHSESKLKAVEEYMRFEIRGDEDESDALWRQIMTYFGERERPQTRPERTIF